MIETIRVYVEQFIRLAELLPELTFYVTRVGCGITGFTYAEIAPLFVNALYLKNVVLPMTFHDVLYSYLMKKKK